MSIPQDTPRTPEPTDRRPGEQGERHTAEPWRVENTADVCAGIDYIATGAYATTDEPETVANARRIVACVNACAEFQTDTLEAGHLAKLYAAAADAFDILDGVACPIDVDPGAWKERVRQRLGNALVALSLGGAK